MATPEQVQKLVARIQAMEAREADGRAREQVLQSTVQNLTNEMARQQQQVATPAPAVSTFATGTVDTRALGKPKVFEGNETKWHDFRVVFKAYCACLNQRLGVLMSGVETNTTGNFVNSGLDQRYASCSIQLYYILLLLCRQQPLTMIVNAGEQEGLTAWQRLVEQYEPQQRTRFAGQLQALLSWKFVGDIEGRIEAFERRILRYEHASGEGVSDALCIGIVLRQLEETKLKEYLLMNTSKLTAWKDFTAEVNTIKRTQANIGPLPMDLDAFSKGKAK
eukprot:247496-Amphidinium_carterae.1